MDSPTSWLRRWFHEAEGRWLVRLGVTLILVTLVVAGLCAREIWRGNEDLRESDRAFHGGDLTRALHKARDAGLHFVPGAPHVQAACARLEAIARGAEAEGNRQLARRAWDAMRLLGEETDYPGRGPNPATERAKSALERLDAAR